MHLRLHLLDTFTYVVLLYFCLITILCEIDVFSFKEHQCVLASVGMVVWVVATSSQTFAWVCQSQKFLTNTFHAFI